MPSEAAPQKLPIERRTTLELYALHQQHQYSLVWQGAIITFTKGASAELAAKKIRVNSIAPGPVWTPLIPQSFPDEIVRRPECADACRGVPAYWHNRAAACICSQLRDLRLRALHVMAYSALV